MQTVVEKSTVEEKSQSMNGDHQAVPCAILRTELGVFYNPFGSDLPAGYSIGDGAALFLRDHLIFFLKE